MNPVEWVVWWNGFAIGVGLGVALTSLLSVTGFLVGGALYGKLKAKPEAVATPAPAAPPTTRGAARRAAEAVLGVQPIEDAIREVRQENEALNIWIESDLPQGRA